MVLVSHIDKRFILCTFVNISVDEDGNLQEKLDESTWLEAFSKCSKNNTTLANFPLQSPKYSKFTTGNNRFWIGIRQYFNPETLKRKLLFTSGS